MIEQQRQRIEQEMTRMVDDLDKHYLRKMQVCCRNVFLFMCFVPQERARNVRRANNLCFRVTCTFVQLNVVMTTRLAWILFRDV